MCKIKKELNTSLYIFDEAAEQVIKEARNKICLNICEDIFCSKLWDIAFSEKKDKKGAL